VNADPLGGFLVGTPGELHRNGQLYTGDRADLLEQPVRERLRDRAQAAVDEQEVSARCRDGMSHAGFQALEHAKERECHGDLQEDQDRSSRLAPQPRADERQILHAKRARLRECFSAAQHTNKAHPWRHHVRRVRASAYRIAAVRRLDFAG